MCDEVTVMSNRTIHRGTECGHTNQHEPKYFRLANLQDLFNRLRSPLRNGSTRSKTRGYLSHLPHYNSVFNYLESEALTPYVNELITLSAAPLKRLNRTLL